MAAVIPSGGAGTGSPLSGLSVPVCRKKVPSLPIWSARTHDAKPDSNPPLKISGVALAVAAANRQEINTLSNTVMLVNFVIEGILRGAFDQAIDNADRKGQLCYRVRFSGGEVEYISQEQKVIQEKRLR